MGAMSDPLPSRPTRRVLLVLGAIVLLGLVVRLGAATATSGYTWDSGLVYVRMARQLPQIMAGEGDGWHGVGSPHYSPAGFPILLRGLHGVGVSYRTAAQLIVLPAGLSMIPLVFLLGRRLGGDGAGLFAAVFVALDPSHVENSVLANVEMPFCALILACAVVASLRRLDRRLALFAAALCGVACLLRAAGLASAVGLVGILLLRRPALDRRTVGSAAALVVGLAVLAVGALQFTQVRNDGSSYAAVQINHSLQSMNAFPDAYYPDSTGATLLLVSPERKLSDVLTAGQVVHILGAGVREAMVAVGLLIGLGVLACFLVPDRRMATLVLLYGLGPLVLSVVACANTLDMARYAIPSRTYLFALLGALVVAVWKRTKLPGPAAIAVACVALGLALAFWPPRDVGGLLRLRAGTTWRQSADAAAEAIAAHLPAEGTRIGRGPGGDTRVVSLAGFHPIYMAAGPTPAHIRDYARLNGLEWIVCGAADAEQMGAWLGPARVQPVLRFPSKTQGEQVLLQVTWPE